MEIRKHTPVVMAVSPVLPPSAMPAPDSMNVVTGDVPRHAPIEIDMASVEYASVERGKDPSLSSTTPENRAMEYIMCLGQHGLLPTVQQKRYSQRRNCLPKNELRPSSCNVPILCCQDLFGGAKMNDLLEEVETIRAFRRIGKVRERGRSRTRHDGHNGNAVKCPSHGRRLRRPTNPHHRPRTRKRPMSRPDRKSQDGQPRTRQRVSFLNPALDPMRTQSGISIKDWTKTSKRSTRRLQSLYPLKRSCAH